MAIMRQINKRGGSSNECSAWVYERSKMLTTVKGFFHVLKICVSVCKL